MLIGDPRFPVPRGCNPFGDGHAGYRAEQAIAWTLGMQFDPPAPFIPTGPTESTDRSAPGRPDKPTGPDELAAVAS